MKNKTSCHPCTDDFGNYMDHIRLMGPHACIRPQIHDAPVGCVYKNLINTYRVHSKVSDIKLIHSNFRSFGAFANARVAKITLQVTLYFDF